MPSAFCPTEKPKQAPNVISHSLKKAAGFMKNTATRDPQTQAHRLLSEAKSKNGVAGVLGLAGFSEGAGTGAGPLSTQQCPSCSSARPKSWLCLNLMPWREHKATAPFWLGWCPCWEPFPSPAVWVSLGCELTRGT